MRSTVQPEPTLRAAHKKHPRQDVRSAVPRSFDERRKTSIFVDRRHQAR